MILNEKENTIESVRGGKRERERIYFIAHKNTIKIEKQSSGRYNCIISDLLAKI